MKQLGGAQKQVGSRLQEVSGSAGEVPVEDACIQMEDLIALVGDTRPTGELNSNSVDATGS